MKIILTILISFFFVSCSTTKRNNLSYIYEQNKVFWEKYPSQSLLFFENNFSKERLSLREKYLDRSYSSVQKTLLNRYKLIEIRNLKNKKVYTYNYNMEDLVLFVEKDVVTDLYFFDLI